MWLISNAYIVHLILVFTNLSVLFKEVNKYIYGII